MNITENTILITGATSGIGRALAEAFYDLGNRVIITGRRQTLLDDMIKVRPGLVGFQLDVTNPDSISKLVAEIKKQFPELNVLIANAGISKAEDLTLACWDISAAESIIETNILGVLQVIAAFLPLLQDQPNATVMATSSSLAFIPKAEFPSYCASKAFLHSWLQSLRHQMRNTSVEVLELAPPYVQTELTGIEQASDPRAVPLNEFIAEILSLLEAQEAPYGEVLVERDRYRRWAERDGKYDQIYAAMNPA